MNLTYQTETLNQLKSIADSGYHSILLQGVRGSGKTYLVNRFSDFKNIDNVVYVDSKIGDLRECMDSSFSIDTDVVVCIENLDSGTFAATNSILKYLEEPKNNVYIMVTCLNTSNLPSTILSRCLEVNLHPPIKEDLELFAKEINPSKFEIVKSFNLFKYIKSLTEVKWLLSLSNEELHYYKNFSENNIFNKDISHISWNLNHYEDKSKSNLSFVLRILLDNYINSNIKDILVESLLDLEESRISESAIINKLVMNIKE